MIYEYALEPEMVATWCTKQNYRFFIREFGLGNGKVVSRYPKNWVKMVYDSYDGTSQMDRKRLVELLARFKKTMVKRKDYCWDKSQGSWLENCLLEQGRYNFHVIMVKSNPENRPGIIGEDDIETPDCTGWNTPHGITVHRKATEMTRGVESVLRSCRWVKFIDPHISPGRPNYQSSFRSFLKILGSKRPVGPPEVVEIHTRLFEGKEEYLLESYKRIIPKGLKVTVFQWKERPNGQKLHNRYILTDLGGVSFHHGLDTGKEGEIDDITLLNLEQYNLHCSQYNSATQTFEEASPPLEIVGL